jgi:chemotaxis protein CheD
MTAATDGPTTGNRLVVVGLGELHVSADPLSTLVTYALGSCLGVVVHDAKAGVGGILHAMMPRSAIDPAKARAQPAMFVDTGVPALFRACYAMGARKDRLHVRLVGAASIHGQETDPFQIGSRNLHMARQLFHKNNVPIHGEDVGGTTWRNLTLAIGTGAVVIGQSIRSRSPQPQHGTGKGPR